MPDRGELMLPGAQEYSDGCIARSRPVVEQSRCVIDVPYGNDFYHKLDIFLPEDKTLSGLPVLLFFHGGAWRHGFKEWLGFMAPVLTDLPAIFVSANYRLAPEAKHPQPFDDCVDALAWLFHNIAGYGGSPERLFVGGHSAGGHLAALVGLKRSAWAARNLPDNVVKACFPLSGPVNLRLDEMDPEGRRIKVTRL
ncbi:MAG: alpha/beta hydrolase, partial [Proteobacteria bacterium]|nr:alpha/beta hydrolase [Pseudomonadota bacterium]